MSRRIFVNVTRGMTDKTAVCIFPWEKPILERIHGGNVEEVSIDEMCDLKGPIKVEKNRIKIKRENGEKPDTPPTLREQLNAMVRVDPEEDPINDAGAEYNRLQDKYGMDSEVNLPVVTVVFGQLSSNAFEAALKEAQGPAPAKAKVAAKGGKKPEDMTVAELKTALKAEGIDFDKDATKAVLVDLLATATA